MANTIRINLRKVSKGDELNYNDNLSPNILTLVLPRTANSYIIVTFKLTKYSSEVANAKRTQFDYDEVLSNVSIQAHDKSKDDR